MVWASHPELQRGGGGDVPACCQQWEGSSDEETPVLACESGAKAVLEGFRTMALDGVVSGLLSWVLRGTRRLVREDSATHLARHCLDDKERWDERGHCTPTPPFELGEKLGEGSFGKVYSCWPTAAGGHCGRRTLCVKVITPNAGRNARFAESDLLHVLRKLEHPHIARYHSVHCVQESLWVIMDRCEGPELQEHVDSQNGPLPYKAVRRIAEQMLRALAAVHGHGLMHRDVKPQNFRFTSAATETLQLLDFGAAKVAGAEPAQHSVTGTLVYAAPEVFGARYGRACDLWSAGVVLFWLVAGQVPFDTPDLAMLRSMHRDPVLTGCSLLRGTRWARAPAAAKSLARGLLCVDPSRRLAADSAASHGWFVAKDLGEVEEMVQEQATTATDLKRSRFVLNLAECCRESDYERFEGCEAACLIGA